MEKIDMLLIAAIIAVAISGLSLFFVIDRTDFTGFTSQTEKGSVNITVLATAGLEFIIDDINWGSGRVDGGEDFAYLDTKGNVIHGNWTPVNHPLVLENKGNYNLTFNITTDTAADFIEGTDPSYKIKLSDNESGSCYGTNSLSTYTETTGSAQEACDNFGYIDTSDSLDIDINITIPDDSPTGHKTTWITVFAATI
jgi:hypothetical protein